MRANIHFEQLAEEIRAAYPDAGAIWATEQPLGFTLDGEQIDLASHLSAHHPLWLSITPDRLPADGSTSARLRVEHPFQANQRVTLRISQGNAVLLEEVPLDGNGIGELEIAATTAGEIRIASVSLPVRISLTAENL